MSDRGPRVAAIVPAAGRSRRMRGRDKLLMPVEGLPQLARFVDLLRQTSLAAVFLVTRSEVAERLGLRDELDPPAAAGARRAVPLRVVGNDDADSEMIDSIRLALGAIEAAPAPMPDGVLVCPADHVRLELADIERCLAAFRARSDAIVVADHDGRGGHPIVFPSAEVVFVRSSACDGGLRALPRRQPERVQRVACGPGVLLDVDTPEDLAGLDDAAADRVP